MKYGIYAVLLFFFICDLAAAVTLSVQPEQPVAGLSAALILTSDDGVPRFRTPPKAKGLRIYSNRISTSQQTQIINGKRSSSATMQIPFVAEKPGEYQIPALDVEVNGKTIRTEPLTITVTAAAATPADAGKNGSNPFFATLQIPGNTPVKTCYVGEELPLDFTVCVATNFPYELQAAEYPSFTTGKGVIIRLRDYRAQNPRMPSFEVFDRKISRIGGKNYIVYFFRTKFRPLAPGELTLNANWPVSFVESRGFFGMEVVDERVFSAALPAITVKPLPAIPPDLPPYCGLIGDWKWSADLNAESSRVGDPITLKLTITGNGSMETFQAPALELPGFRMYPPETERKKNAIELRYTLIPLKEGEQNIRFAASVFSPGADAYKPYIFQRTVNVKKAETLVATSKTYVDATGADPGEEVTAKTQPRHKDVLYLHKDLSGTVRLPLWLNTAMMTFGLVFCGFIFFFAALLAASQEKAFRNDPAKYRKHNARKQKKHLMKKIRETAPENLTDVSGELSQYLNDVMDLPPGTSLDSAAGEFNEERTVPFAHALKTIANAAWIPGVSAELTPELKKDLLKGLSKFVTVLLFFGTLTLAAGENAMTAYDNGDYKAALESYAGMLKNSPNAVSPALLYNMGNCYYQLGDTAMAAVCYERAMRLAPRDSDVLVNLNLMRRKMMLPERYKVEHPGDLLVTGRDMLRLDEWILLAALALTVCLCALGLRSPGKSAWRIVLFTAIPVLLLAVIAAVCQIATLYSTAPALVIHRNAPVYSLPSTTNGKLERQLKEGEEVRLEETRLEWARIRIGEDEEGWILRKDILPLWNEDQKDLLKQEE